jgi:GNAT superfamily N-acetyltransferase
MTDSGIDTTVFDLAGTHYDIGVAIARGSLPFAVPSWWPEPPPLAYAQACAREIAALHPALLDEIHGHADGQHLSYNELIRLICRQRLGGRAVVPPVVPEQGGCISFVWRAPNGHILVGRNYDFYSVQRIRQRIRLHPDGSRPSVGMRGSVPAGRYDGVNDAGLFVCLHVVLADEPKSPRPGVPFHLIPRILLETCRSVKEALDLITIMPHLHSFNYLLADPDGFAAVECHADRLRILYPQGDILATGNFFRHPDMAVLQRHRRQPVSRRRVAYLESGAWQSGESWQAVQTTLRDHGTPVCGHDGGHTTLWSAVADLTARRIVYATGAPCCTPYTEVSWPA